MNFATLAIGSTVMIALFAAVFTFGQVRYNAGRADAIAENARQIARLKEESRAEIIRTGQAYDEIIRQIRLQDGGNSPLPDPLGFAIDSLPKPAANHSQ